MSEWDRAPLVEPPSGWQSAPLATSGSSASVMSRIGRTADDVVRAIASGATFGFADELAAGLTTLTGVGRQEGGGGTYARNVASERARDKAIPSEGAIPAEIAGGVATAIAAGPATGVALAAKGLAKAPGWLKAAGLGGAYGGLYGAG